MKLVVVSDIFGKTESFLELVSEISPHFSEIELITPYGDEIQKFENEQEAYHKFSIEIGINNYKKNILAKLQGKELTDQLLLGFSVGATAIWLASSIIREYDKTKAICFYSSQIRNHLSVTPQIPIEFYFAKAELRYEVDDVMASLESTQNLKCHNTKYKHGFMNKDSQNYNQEAYNKYLKILKRA